MAQKSNNCALKLFKGDNINCRYFNEKGEFTDQEIYYSQFNTTKWYCLRSAEIILLVLLYFSVVHYHPFLLKYQLWFNSFIIVSDV